MEARMLTIIFSTTIGISWTVVFFLIKMVLARMTELTDKTEENTLRIVRLEEKLWSEDKLERVVEGAVEKVFLRFENKQLLKQIKKQ